MKITSSRKKFRDYVEKHFMQDGTQPIEYGAKIRRDGRVKSLDKKRKLITRERYHTELATAFYNFIKSKPQVFPFEVVPVKSQEIPVIIGHKKLYDVIGYAQRYFHRPTLSALNSYLWLKEQGVEIKKRNELNSLDDSYCMHLMHEEPCITRENLIIAIGILEKEFKEAREKNILPNFVDFSATNYLVFGVNKKTGKLKIGVIDV